MTDTIRPPQSEEPVLLEKGDLREFLTGDELCNGINSDGLFYLIRRVQSDNEEVSTNAIDLLLRSHGALVGSILRRNGISTDSATYEDDLQLASIGIIEAARGHNLEITSASSFYAYAHVLGRREIVDMRREGGTNAGVSISSDLATALSLKYDGFTDTEIAEHLGIVEHDIWHTLGILGEVAIGLGDEEDAFVYDSYEFEDAGVREEAAELIRRSGMSLDEQFAFCVMNGMHYLIEDPDRLMWLKTYLEDFDGEAPNLSALAGYEEVANSTMTYRLEHANRRVMMVAGLSAVSEEAGLDEYDIDYLLEVFNRPKGMGRASIEDVAYDEMFIKLMGRIREHYETERIEEQISAVIEKVRFGELEIKQVKPQVIEAMLRFVFLNEHSYPDSIKKRVMNKSVCSDADRLLINSVLYGLMDMDEYVVSKGMDGDKGHPRD